MFKKFTKRLLGSVTWQLKGRLPCIADGIPSNHADQTSFLSRCRATKAILCTERLKIYVPSLGCILITEVIQSLAIQCFQKGCLIPGIFYAKNLTAKPAEDSTSSEDTESWCIKPMKTLITKAKVVLGPSTYSLLSSCCGNEIASPVRVVFKLLWTGIVISARKLLAFNIFVVRMHKFKSYYLSPLRKIIADHDKLVK